MGDAVGDGLGVGSGIVISGVAWSTCLGDDADAWEALLAGRSGLAMHALRPHGSEPVTALLGLHPSSQTVDPVAWAVDVARRALADAGLPPDVTDSTGLVLATSLGRFDPDDDQPPEAWGAAVASKLGAPQPPLVVSTACASGTDAVAVARDLLVAGAAERVLVVAMDVVTPTKVQGQVATGLLSRSGRLRPFHEGRDGTAVSDASAAVVLELPAAATRRGVTARARIVGTASGLDATSFTAGDASGRGVARVLHRALAAAGALPSEVAVLSAHATSTQLNDLTEARAYGEVFGDAGGPLVLATKPALGHSLGSTGLVEVLTVVHALETRDCPPVLGMDDPPRPLPELRLALAGPGARLDRGELTGVSVSTGIGGSVSAVVLRSCGSGEQPGDAVSLPAVASPTLLAEASRQDVDPAAVRRLLPRTYADPVAWLLADVAGEALATAARTAGDVSPEWLGCIVVSDTATAQTRAGVLAAASEGFVSPARFAATSASTLAAALCQTCSVQGQSVTLLAPPDPGVDRALDLAGVWLVEGKVRRVVVCLHHTTRAGHQARCLVLGSQPGQDGRPSPG
jgi:3-oxoacyl-[acyl-carrier-protein] synthase II